MPWFNVDDGFAFHPKAIKAGNSAIGLWTRAGSWAALHLTDGFVPEHMVRALGTLAQADRLVESGLWIPVDKGVDKGFQFHQWSEDRRNPSRGEVLERRRRDAERQREFRDLQRATSTEPQVTSTGRNVTDNVTDYVTPDGRPTGVQASPPLPTLTSPNGEVTTSRSAELFAKFWAVYPRKIGKKAAEKAWVRALRGKADPDALIEAAATYAVYRQGQDQKFTPHASTWLNQGRWEDEPEQPRLRAVGEYRPFVSNRDPEAWKDDL